jgi:hypothetical protein
MRISPHSFLVLVYTVGVIGVFFQIIGANWDVTWHILGIVETFFTLPRSVLYIGIVLVMLISLVGLLMRVKFVDSERPLLMGLYFAFVGSVLQVLAGPLDFSWHDRFGFDPFLFTIPHSFLIIGMTLDCIGMAIGSVRLIQAQKAGILGGLNSRKFEALAIVALSSLWLVMNFFYCGCSTLMESHIPLTSAH